MLPVFLYGQKDYRARLQVYGGFSEIGVSPSEEIWIATKAGCTYYTKNVQDLWHFGTFGTKDPYNDYNGALRGTFERVNFFTEDTMMISGFIHGENSVQNFVYWSGNHGKTWKKVIFGQSSWIDAAYVTEDGKAWMSGSSQLIYYTDDYGQTWQTFDKVEKTGGLRFVSVHFLKDGKTGLFGSTWNVIYKTTDNCHTWQKIPTPLDQKKYKQLSNASNDKPNIRKIKIIGDYYWINQKGHIFYTKSDSINWMACPQIFDFEPTGSNNIYIINKDLSVELWDAELNKKWKSTEKLDEYPRVITKNESLFVVTLNSVFKINPNEFIRSELFTEEVPVKEPYQKLDWHGMEIGFDRNDLLRFDYETKRWYRDMTLPIEVENAAMYNNELIISDPTLEKRYSIDLPTKQVNDFTLPNTLLGHTKPDIISFSIESGSQGCFHYQLKKDEYKKDKNCFVKVKQKKPESLGLPDKIPFSSLYNVLNIADSCANRILSVKELNVTVEDIDEYKKFIMKEEEDIKKNDDDLVRLDFDNLYHFPGKNTDFDFYRNTADSLYNLSDSVVTQVFNLVSPGWSTTTNWIRLSITLENKEVLYVYNQDYEPGYLYNPWRIDYNGLIVKCPSFKLGMLMNELTSGKVLKKDACEKKYAIYKIADYLYRQSENFETE